MLLTNRRNYKQTYEHVTLLQTQANKNNTSTFVEIKPVPVVKQVTIWHFFAKHRNTH